MGNFGWLPLSALIRHFIGTVEQTQCEATNNQLQNIFHLWDISIERQITSRFSGMAGMPVLFAYRNQLYNPIGKFTSIALAM